MAERYEDDLAGDAVIMPDGDGFFVGLDGRTIPENLAPGIVALSENMRFNERVAQVRGGMEKQTNDIFFPSKALILPFVLTIPGPIIRDVYADGIFESCVYSDETTNLEWIAVATGTKCFLFRPGEPVVELDYPTAEIITPEDQVDMFQTMASLYILRGELGITQAVVSITRVGAVATLTTAVAHNLITGQLLQVAGADQPEYNGIFPVTFVNGTTVTYAVSGTPATPATGLIVANEKKRPLRWDGDVTQDFVTVPYGVISMPYIYMPPSDFGLVMQNRVVLQYSRNQSIVSEVLAPEQYNSIYGVFNFREGEADYLIGFHPYQVNQALVFNRRSVYLKTGLDGDVATMEKRELTRQIGCVSRRSVATCGSVVLFLSDNGVYVLEPGLELQLRGNSEPLSAAVDNIIARINTSSVQSAYGIYFNNRYYLAVPVDLSERNNVMLVYNFLNQQWETLDTFPNGFFCDFMEVINDGERDALYLLSREGGIYQHEVLEVDEFGAADSDPGQFLIAGNLVTRRLIFGSTDLKRFARCSLNVNYNEDAGILVSAISDNAEDVKDVLADSVTLPEDKTNRALIGQRAYGVQLQFQNTATRLTVKNYRVQAYTQDRKTITTE